MTAALIAAAVLLAAVAVWRLRCANRKLTAIHRDFTPPAPAPDATPNPKENPAA